MKYVGQECFGLIILKGNGQTNSRWLSEESMIQSKTVLKRKTAPCWAEHWFVDLFLISYAHVALNITSRVVTFS